MKITAETARNIVWEAEKNWEKVPGSERITDHGRWTVSYEAIFHSILDNKFYLFNWRRGATESQDEEPFEYEKEVTLTEVHEVEKLVKVWEPKESL